MVFACCVFCVHHEPLVEAQVLNTNIFFLLSRNADFSSDRKCLFLILVLLCRSNVSWLQLYLNVFGGYVLNVKGLSPELCLSKAQYSYSEISHHTFEGNQEIKLYVTVSFHSDSAEVLLHQNIHIEIFDFCKVSIFRTVR